MLGPGGRTAAPEHPTGIWRGKLKEVSIVLVRNRSALLLGVLAFFAVVVDMFDRLGTGWIAGNFLPTVAEGGELLAISVTVALAFVVYGHFGNPVPVERGAAKRTS